METVQTATYDFSPPLVLHNLQFTYSLSFQPKCVVLAVQHNH